MSVAWYKKDISLLKKNIYAHDGMRELECFYKNLKKTPLDSEELKIFMATLWAFYSETPSGILNLALRVSDFWRDINPWEANAKAAHLLYANMDEFGLHAFQEIIYPTHHQLFKKTAHYFGVSTKDLCSARYILKGGIDIGKASYKFYRKKSIPMGLGFHLSSELTSFLEFKYFLDGILTHREIYNVKSENDPALKFFYIHTVVEPAHLDNSEKIVSSFCEIAPDAMHDIVQGANIYMDFYKKLFESINSKIYS